MKKFTDARIHVFVLIGFVLIAGAAEVFGQNRGRSVRTITVITEPDARVWLDEVSRGATDEQGRLVISPVAPGSHSLRIRAAGFKEYTKTLTPAQKGELRVQLVPTADRAELAFQAAEKTVAEDPEKARELFLEAIRLRPNYPAALIGLARLLTDEGETDEALATLKKLRKYQPIHSEAAAVEGRIYVFLGEEEKAVKSFERAIREGRGFQPEAYAGLGLFYKEKAEIVGSSGNFGDEEFYYDKAAEALKKAVTQLSGAPDALVLYQIVGLIYEKMREYEKAIAVYEDFLQTFPDVPEASAVRSFIVQIKKQMARQ